MTRRVLMKYNFTDVKTEGVKKGEGEKIYKIWQKREREREKEREREIKLDKGHLVLQCVPLNVTMLSII